MESLLASGVVNNLMAELCLLNYLLGRNCKVCVCHVLRTYNEVVDHMAKYANFEFLSLCVFDEPPLSVRELLLTDCNNRSQA